MKIAVNGGLGDEISVTSLIREAKRRMPEEMIVLHGRIRPQVWENNPYLNWGNRDDGRVIACYSYEPKHKGTLTAHYMKLAGFSPADIVDDLPELFFTRDELAAPLTRTLRMGTSDEVREPIEIPKGTIAIDPGAGWPTRRWGYQKFEQLALQLKASGYRIIQVGSREEHTLDAADEVLVDQLDIRQVARVIGACALFVGNESGYYHMAAAVGTPHVILYGPTRHTAGPYSTTTPLVPATECAPKCYIHCIRPGPNQVPWNHCMAEISLDQVLEACGRALASPRPPSRLYPRVSVLGRDASLQEALGRTGKRRATFERACSLARERGAKLIVETGTLRSWDAGGSTVVWARLAEDLDAAFYTIDVDKTSLYCAAGALGPDLVKRTSFLNDNSVQVLRNLAEGPRRIDLLYLDSLDVRYDLKHQEHQLQEIQAAAPGLSEKAVVILDDDFDGGKADRSRPWLEANGWSCIAREYQSVFIRKR